jgi:hypothetical protein
VGGSFEKYHRETTPSPSRRGCGRAFFFEVLWRLRFALASSRAAQLGGYASPGGMRDLLVAIDAGFVVWNVLNDRGDVAFLCVRFALARQQPRGPAGGVCLPEGNAGFVGG